jgi:hypothetical protein
MLARAGCLAVFSLFLFALPGWSTALSQTPSPDPVTIVDVVNKIHQELQEAKTQKEIASIEMYCRDKIATYSFQERDRLSVEAITFMEKNQIEEENANFRRIEQLEELDKHLANMSCSMTDRDRALRHPKPKP